jgi:hypothetical protein
VRAGQDSAPVDGSAQDSAIDITFRPITKMVELSLDSSRLVAFGVCIESGWLAYVTHVSCADSLRCASNVSVFRSAEARRTRALSHGSPLL